MMLPHALALFIALMALWGLVVKFKLQHLLRLRVAVPFKPHLEENAATQTSFPVLIQTVNIARHPTLPNPPVCWLLIATAPDINNKRKFFYISKISIGVKIQNL